MNNLSRFLSTNKQDVPDVPKIVPRSIVYNDRVEVGNSVRLNPSSYWGRINDEFNPIGINGVIEKIQDTEIYVKWDNGHQTAYYRFWDDNFL